jgi:hypothetical protein
MEQFLICMGRQNEPTTLSSVFFLQKLVVTQLVQKFPFYGNPSFVSLSTKARFLIRNGTNVKFSP